MNVEEIGKMPFDDVKAAVEEMNQELIMLRDKCKRQEKALKVILNAVAEVNMEKTTGSDYMATSSHIHRHAITDWNDAAEMAKQGIVIKSTRGRKPKAKPEEQGEPIPMPPKGSNLL